MSDNISFHSQLLHISPACAPGPDGDSSLQRGAQPRRRLLLEPVGKSAIPAPAKLKPCSTG